MKMIARAAFLLAAGLLSACASGAQIGQMVAAPGKVAVAEQTSPMYRAVTVGNVAGGEDTNPMWMSKVGSADFAEALRQTLTAHSMLGKPEDSRYVLEANLKSLEQPMFGLTLDVTSKVAYRLRDKKAGLTVIDEDVTATGSAGVSDAFAAVERLRISNERSIKNNIQDFMLRLDRVKAPAVPTS